MTAQALLDTINKAIDTQQNAVQNGVMVSSFIFRDVEVLQHKAKKLMHIISTDGDRNLTKEEKNQLDISIP